MSEAAPTIETDGIVRCDACPVLCRIRPGKLGACDRYGNVDGKLVRTDPLVLLDRSVESGRGAVRFLEGARDWSGDHPGWMQVTPSFRAQSCSIAARSRLAKTA